MPPTTHNVRGSNATYELRVDVVGIIPQGLEGHIMDDIDVEM
jgi:hypothetical protein